MPQDARQRIHEFFRTGSQLLYQKGEVILRPDEVPAGVFYIEKGYIKIYSIRNSGELSLHIVYGPGELFPLIWAFRGHQGNVFYEALNNVSLLRVRREDFVRFAFSDTQVAKVITEVVTDLFWLYSNRVENLELPSAYERVLFRMALIARRFGVPGPSGSVLIEAPISQQDIADSLHMARETASREIAKLAKKGILGYHGRYITVLDPQRLQDEAAKLR